MLREIDDGLLLHTGTHKHPRKVGMSVLWDTPNLQPYTLGCQPKDVLANLPNNMRSMAEAADIVDACKAATEVQVYYRSFLSRVVRCFFDKDASTAAI